MQKSFILILLFGFVLTGCRSDDSSGLRIKRVETPEWAVTGQHPDYPTEQWFTGWGVANSGAKSHEQATRNLETALTNEARSVLKPLVRGTEFGRIVTKPAQWIPSELFETAIKGDVYAGGFDVVTVQALQRDEFRLRASTVLDQETEHLVDAEPPIPSDNVAQWLTDSGEYFLLAARVLALHAVVHGKLNRQAFRLAEDAALKLWSFSARLDVQMDGDRQRVEFSGNVANELGLFISRSNEFVRGLPLEWSATQGFPVALDGESATNNVGYASCKILHAMPNGAANAYIQAMVNPNVGLSGDTGISMPVWKWRVNLPNATNTVMVFDVKEVLNNGDEPIDPVFVPAFTAWAEKNGYLVLKDLPKTLDDDTWYLSITGELKALVDMKASIPNAAATGTLTLRDARTNYRIYSYSPARTHRGEDGNSPKTIAQLAMKEAAADGVYEIASRVVAISPLNRSGG